MNNIEKKESLGFLFGFKETSQLENNSFVIEFKHGISKKYPKKYELKKDFYVNEVFSGDYSPLHINIFELKKAYQSELDNNNQDNRFCKELFKIREELYNPKISFEQYVAFTSLDYALMNFNLMHQDFFSVGEKKEILKEILADKFSNQNIIELYENHNAIGTYLYNKSLTEFNDEFKIIQTVSKLKI